MALDVFISYAHIDNQPLLADTKGWVTVFHDALQQLLSRFKGSNALIWRDPKLAGNDVLWREIEARIAEAAVLVTVLSPRYVSSPSCSEEIQSFCRSAERTGGLVIDHSARVFKVIKTPVEGAQGLPPIVGDLLGYEFFRLDVDKTPQELDPLFGEDAREEFLRKVNKVAWDIKRLLDQLRQAAPAAETGAAVTGAAKPVVYLAECSRDRRDARDNIEAELKRLGYTVLPDRQLPTDEVEYVAAVDALLARCAYSIHLIGAGYGLVPDGAGQKSVVVLQNERAAARFGANAGSAAAAGMRRAIWLPADTRAEHPLQQAFIEALHTDAQAQAGADLLTGDIEAFKTAIRAQLKRIEQPPPAAPPSRGS
ncbi:MAG: toll/interleukin-1 receptor domain-containing protein, partial [Thauera sp.]|nr:toll/interleukin-1 receptor domain-containing protein [Thauera sp.]